jgi:hypothetical protein
MESMATITINIDHCLDILDCAEFKTELELDANNDPVENLPKYATKTQQQQVYIPQMEHDGMFPRRMAGSIDPVLLLLSLPPQYLNSLNCCFRLTTSNK